jgi:hypothetical protein
LYGLAKSRAVGAFKLAAESGFEAGPVFCGGEGFDFQQGLKQTDRQLGTLLKNLTEGIEIAVVIRAWVWQEMFGWQKMSETFKKPREGPAADLTQNLSIGKEFRCWGIHGSGEQGAGSVERGRSWRGLTSRGYGQV